jgi:hypothetical protein
LNVKVLDNTEEDKGSSTSRNQELLRFYLVLISLQMKILYIFKGFINYLHVLAFSGIVG